MLKTCLNILFTIGILGLTTTCSQISKNNEVDLKYRQTIKEYYQAFKNIDKEALKKILSPDLKHISSYAIYSDRDKMIKDIWPTVGKNWAEDLEIFGSYPEFMVRYKVVGDERLDQRMAEYIRFKGEKINEIEVFIGRELI